LSRIFSDNLLLRENTEVCRGHVDILDGSILEQVGWQYTLAKAAGDYNLDGRRWQGAELRHAIALDRAVNLKGGSEASVVIHPGHVNTCLAPGLRHKLRQWNEAARLAHPAKCPLNVTV